MKGYVTSCVENPGPVCPVMTRDPTVRTVKRERGTVVLTIELSGDYGGKDALTRIMGKLVEIELSETP